jgi:hypothetical protein
LDAQEALAKSDEDGDMKDRIWGQLVQLNPVDKEEATKKFVNRNGEVANEEVNEDYPETGRRMGRTLVSRHPHGFIAEHAHLLQQLFVLRREL